MRNLFCVLFLLLAMAVSALATPYDVGDILPSSTPWAPRGVADQAVSTPTLLLLDYTATTGVALASAVSSATAKIYLYATTSARVVTRVYGPLELRSWAPPRDLLTMAGPIHAIHVESVTGECIVTVGY